MGGGSGSDDQPEAPGGSRDTLTAEEAARRVETLRRVYNQGYLSHYLYESLKRAIEARVSRTGTGGT